MSGNDRAVARPTRLRCGRKPSQAARLVPNSQRVAGMGTAETGVSKKACDTSTFSFWSNIKPELTICPMSLMPSPDTSVQPAALESSRLLRSSMVLPSVTKACRFNAPVVNELPVTCPLFMIFLIKQRQKVYFWGGGNLSPISFEVPFIRQCQSPKVLRKQIPVEV